MQTSKTISLVQYRKAGELRSFLEARCAKGEWEGLGISKLCTRFAVCESLLARAFRRRYGLSIHAFIIGQKLLFAKSLLFEGSFTVKEVADRAGYTSVSNFSRDFARLTGMSPMAWRNCGVYQRETRVEA